MIRNNFKVRKKGAKNHTFIYFSSENDLTRLPIECLSVSCLIHSRGYKILGCEMEFIIN
jgi:hypothetical protein